MTDPTMGGVCGDGKKGPGELCDDGNLIDDDGCTNNCEGPPEAAVLKLSFSQVKQFDFSWAAANGATFYRLLERPTPNASYAQLGADIVGTATSRTMPLHLRLRRELHPEACNDGGLHGLGAGRRRRLDGEGGRVLQGLQHRQVIDLFGSSVALSGDGNTSRSARIGGQRRDRHRRRTVRQLRRQ
jgi:cysteine-rich repeat protein